MARKLLTCAAVLLLLSAAALLVFHIRSAAPAPFFLPAKEKAVSRDIPVRMAPQTENVREDRINVNTATLEELQMLPGIGKVTAQAIIDEREKQPFRYPEDLNVVKGIGEKTLRKIRDLICFD